MTEQQHGVVVVDKPVGPTSFAIVRSARRLTGIRKIGHGGTLDPLASGVLPLCLGEATKLAQFLLDADKEYEATVRFGAETDTYDAAGAVTATAPTDDLDEGRVRDALTAFLGEQQQVPPMYSALKRDGRPLHDYARAGEVVDRPARTVRIMKLELRSFSVPEAGAPEATLFIHCSKGTYVRSLAHDLGRAVGTGAHISALRRTRSGPFTLAQAIAPEALGVAPLPLVALADALAHLPSLVVSDGLAAAVAEGRRVPWQDVFVAAAVLAKGTRVRLLTEAGALLAVAPVGAADDPVQTLRVFRGALRDGAGMSATARTA
jgi:tRNA pseudouridine55 synthase